MVETTTPQRVRQAIRNGDTDLAKALLVSHPNLIQMMTPFGSWLHIAAFCGNTEAAKMLIQVGVHVNVKGGTFGGNALNEAASGGHLETVKFLRSAGADMDVSEPERNPLFAAILGGHLDVVKFLLDQGIDYKVRYSGRHMSEMDARLFALEQGEREIAAVIANH
jgi:ankyrin repeat protein